MESFLKPLVVVSRCLGFAKCRTNGETIPNDFIKKLGEYADFITPCPEVEIGLGIPRKSVRIVMRKGSDEKKLVQSATNLDCTDKMTSFCDSFLSSLGEVDGFILKGQSPSCGIKNIKYYPSTGKVAPVGKGEGLFGGFILKNFPLYPVEDEGRLKNFVIREHFLTRLFLMPKIRRLKKDGKMKDIVKFQSENKLLLMAYNQNLMRKMGRLVANKKDSGIEELRESYVEMFLKAIEKRPKYTSNINVLMHALGYFKNILKMEEKAFFLDSLEMYRKGKVPLSVPIHLVKSYIIKYKEEYLKMQTFFEPYPFDLIDISDSGKGR